MSGSFPLRVTGFHMSLARGPLLQCVGGRLWSIYDWYRFYLFLFVSFHVQSDICITPRLKIIVFLLLNRLLTKTCLRVLNKRIQIRLLYLYDNMWPGILHRLGEIEMLARTQGLNRNTNRNHLIVTGFFPTNVLLVASTVRLKCWSDDHISRFPRLRVFMVSKMVKNGSHKASIRC